MPERANFVRQFCAIYVRHPQAATNLLPPAATATDARMEVDLDAGPDGRVRFFAEKKQVKHHRHSHYFWAVYRAEPIRSDDPI